jgi:hypothetical protein
MTMNYSTTLDSATYLQRLQEFMKAVEGETFTPYVDYTGNPTIGWGFALNNGVMTTDKALTNIIETVLGVFPKRNSGGLSAGAKTSEAAFEASLTATLNQSWPADLTIHQTGQSTQDLQAERIIGDGYTFFFKLICSDNSHPDECKSNDQHHQPHRRPQDPPPHQSQRHPCAAPASTNGKPSRPTLQSA